jgi:hypothetical protein
MVEIEPPTERVCERCGRWEVWDGERRTWRTPADATEDDRGRPHCLHEWDINGAYSALAE